MTADAPQQQNITSDLKKRRRPGESIIVGSLFVAGAVSIAITIGILFELGTESLLFFRDPLVSFWGFVTGTVWQPQAGTFGIWPLILGTLLITIIALIVAVPLGLAAAIYLSEYASSRVRGFFKPVLEILVGIPTVVFGFFAITFMTPVLRSIFGTSVVGFFNVLSAGIVVGIDLDRLEVYKHQLDEEARVGRYDFFDLSLELLNEQINIPLGLRSALTCIANSNRSLSGMCISTAIETIALKRSESRVWYGGSGNSA